MNVLTIILAEGSTVDGWGPAIVSTISSGGIAAAFAWYLLVKVGPKTEEEHKKQLMEQRVDLLALVAKERETLERVLSVMSDARFASIKDMNESVVEMHNGIDILTRIVNEVKEELKRNTSVVDELKRSQEELRKLYSGGK